MIKELPTVNANCNNIEALQIHDKTANKSVLLPKKRYVTKKKWKRNLDFILSRKEGSQPAVGLNQMKKI